MPEPRHLAIIAAAVLVAVIVIVRPTGAPAATRAVNGLQVARLDDGRIEVWTSAGRGPVDYWCAVGDFARTRLGAANGQPIQLVATTQRSAVQRNRRAVVFALGDGGVTSATASINRVGTTFTVGATINFCQVSLQRQDRNERR